MEESKKLQEFITKEWESNCIPAIQDYIRVPNVSPAYDPDCLTNGHMDSAIQLIQSWIAAQEIQGLEMELIKDEGRTPLLFVEIKAFDGKSPTDSGSRATGTVLMYGHMDKQPPFTGWLEGLAPYEPVIRNGKLYGRGGADDGYSSFCAMLSIKALQQFGKPHARIVFIAEACEESGSPDLPHYVTKLQGKIGSPNLIICLDSGAGNYEQLWITSSLRGLCAGTLEASVLENGVHSGDSSGAVPDTFRIVRKLLSRIEDEDTGEIKLEELYGDLSEKTKDRVKKAVAVMSKEEVLSRFPWLPGASAITDSAEDLALNRWWRPQLAVVGASGLPEASTAGNVLRPSTSLRLSVRLPPDVDAARAGQRLAEELTREPPYGARVEFKNPATASGWAAPDTAAWLEESLADSSNAVFGKPAMYHSEGGSIPFMGMLAKLFPRAQFLVTGVLGPESNAHGPNEALDIAYSGKLTCCVALVLWKHFESKVEMILNGSEAVGEEKPAAVKQGEKPAEKPAAAKEGKKKKTKKKKEDCVVS